MKLLFFFSLLSIFIQPIYAAVIISDGVLSADGKLLDQFYISKSSNTNRVMYSLEVDQICRFIEKKPIFPYWQKREISDDYYENLNFLEKQYFSLGESRIEGNSFKFQIKVFAQIAALPLVLRSGIRLSCGREPATVLAMKSMNTKMYLRISTEILPALISLKAHTTQKATK